MRGQFGQRPGKPARETQGQERRAKQSQEPDPSDKPLIVTGHRNEVGLGQQDANPKLVTGTEFKRRETSPPSFPFESYAKTIGPTAVVISPLRHRRRYLREPGFGNLLQRGHASLVLGLAIPGRPQHPSVVGQDEHHSAQRGAHGRRELRDFIERRNSWLSAAKQRMLAAQ